MADQPRVPYRCDTCGQTDDHPKMHYGAQTFHHDCIPAFVLDDLTSEGTFQVENNQVVLVSRTPLPDEDLHPGTQQLLKIIDKAKSGTRGAKLQSWIQDLPVEHEPKGSPNNGRKASDRNAEEN